MEIAPRFRSALQLTSSVTILVRRHTLPVLYLACFSITFLLVASLLAGCQPVTAAKPMVLVQQKDLPPSADASETLLIAALGDITLTESVTSTSAYLMIGPAPPSRPNFSTPLRRLLTPLR